MSSSEGRPTAVPCALSETIGYLLISISSVGVYAPATAFASVAGAIPTPSITIVRTGPLTPLKLLSFSNFALIIFLQKINFYPI